MPGDGATVRSIVTAIGEDLMYRKNEELKKFMKTDDDMDKKLSGQVRVNCSGKAGSSVDDLQWVPDSLKAIGYPENMSTFGSPYLHCMRPGVVKTGPSDIHLWGFGQFVIGHAGAVWLVSWPARFATDLAMDVRSTFDDVAALNKISFTEFLKNTAFHCLLVKDTVAWVPYGHCYALIPLQGQMQCNGGCSFALSVPYMSLRMLHSTHAASRMALGTMMDKLQNNPMVSAIPKYAAILNQFVHWFKSSLEVDEGMEEDAQDGSQEAVPVAESAAGSTQPPEVPASQSETQRGETMESAVATLQETQAAALPEPE